MANEEEEMVLVPKSAIAALDGFIHGLYSDRCFIRNHCYDINEASGSISDLSAEDVILNDARFAKRVAKAFGLYPYNQTEVKYPLVFDEKGYSAPQ